MKKKPTRAKCPNCGKPFEWDTSVPWRPFCSERCKLIDLGEWINEGHRIEGDKAEGQGPREEP